jgi:hypothetical protein
MVVGAGQIQQSQHAVEGLVMPTGVSGWLPACTQHRRPSVVGRVCVNELLNSTCCYKDCLAARHCLDRFKVTPVDGVPAYKGFDLGYDFGLDDRRERRFFSVSVGSLTGRASQMASLTSINCSHVARNSRYVSTSFCILVRSGPGRSCKVFVLPFSFLVKA